MISAWSINSPTTSRSCTPVASSRLGRGSTYSGARRIRTRRGCFAHCQGEPTRGERLLEIPGRMPAPKTCRPGVPLHRVAPKPCRRARRGRRASRRAGSAGWPVCGARAEAGAGAGQHERRRAPARAAAVGAWLANLVSDPAGTAAARGWTRARSRRRRPRHLPRTHAGPGGGIGLRGKTTVGRSILRLAQPTAGARALPRTGSPDSRRGGAPTTEAEAADGVSGPDDLAQSAHARARHPRRRIARVRHRGRRHRNATSARPRR